MRLPGFADLRPLAVLLALTSPLTACAAGDDDFSQAGRPDGVYRMASSGDVWKLAMSGRRFAVTRSDRRGCTWAYGGLSARGEQVELRVVDAAGPAAAAVAEPTDVLRLHWSRYRDVMELHALSAGTAAVLAAAPWRRVAGTDGPSSFDRRCHPPAAALTPTGVENLRPTGATLSFSGDFVKTGPAHWEGRGTAKDLGPGRMTIDGRVVLGHLTRSRITFTLRVSRGIMHGCSITTIWRRPRGRYVWDGPGQITATSPRLHEYLALSGGIGGVTYTYARDRMHGGFGSHPGPHHRRGSRPDVVC
jgi:hypothetical protein